MGSVIHITEANLPLAWEKSVIELYEKGRRVATQYDKDGDLPSADMTAVIEVTEPMSEPRIHRGFPDTIPGLEAYRQEVLDGIHDHWICPEEGKWEYTYHERLFAYGVPGLDKPVNQMQYVVDALKKCSFTRRAQAITWKPWEDAGIVDPACLQRFWFRIIDGKLQMNAHMRSNDAFKAAFMNMYAFTELQKRVADEVGVAVGSYIHIADSYHIYGFDHANFENFVQLTKKRTFEERTYRTDDENVQEMLEEARQLVIDSLEEEKRTGRKGLRL